MAPASKYEGFSLGSQLTKLRGESASCVFIVRKIAFMGFQSQELLASYFSHYGVVKSTLVVHSKVRQGRGLGSGRFRPGNLGFVVMEAADAVEQVFREGKTHTVAGGQVQIEEFQHTDNTLGPGSTASADSTSAGDRAGSTSQNGSNRFSGSGSNSASMDSQSGSNGSENLSGSGSNRSEKSGSEKGSEKGSGSHPLGDGSRVNNGAEASAEAGSTDSQNAEGSESGSGTDAARRDAGTSETPEKAKKETMEDSA